MHCAQALQAVVGRLASVAAAAASGGVQAAPATLYPATAGRLATRSYGTAAEALAAAPPAFVFDIDGVLIQGRHTLPHAAAGQAVRAAGWPPLLST